MGLNHISKLWWFTRFEIAVRMDESNSERILQGHWSARRRLKLRTWIIGKSEVQISKKKRHETKRVTQLSTGAGQKILDHPEVLTLWTGKTIIAGASNSTTNKPW
jgi:hypothetical protein